MEEMILSQENSLSEKTKGQYAMFKDLFEKYRNGRGYCDDLICEFVRVFCYGFKSEDGTLLIRQSFLCKRVPK